MTLIEFVTGIADAIRSKEQSTDEIPAMEFAERISNLPTGGGLLPAEYQQVEYIDSNNPEDATGDNYIDLNFNADANINYVAVLGLLNWRGDQFILGGGEANKMNFLSTSGSSYTNGIYFGYGSNWGSSITVPNVQKTKIMFYYGYKFVDNKTQTASVGTFTNTTPFSLFKIMWNGARSKTRLNVRLFKFEAYRNSEKICDLYPCYRKSDNEIGMYDIITQTFFTNAGTGTFLKGADV